MLEDFDMCVEIKRFKSKFKLTSSHTFLPFVSLLFGLLLFSSFLICVFGGVFSVSAVVPDVFVDDEDALLDAVDEVSSAGGGSVVLALMCDIELMDGEFVIPPGVDVTLMSDGVDVWALVGLDGSSTIVIKDGGVLTLAGIVVTHNPDEYGAGVIVEYGGILNMIDGEISGNNVTYYGGGVYNYGSFTMSGGVISGNAAGYGGGVCNYGSFELFGGKITNNIAWAGGGVCNYGTSSFELSGGEVSGNTASFGGGVCNYGSFELSGGVISGSAARWGGGIYTDSGFVMYNGTVLGNTARSAGGGVYNTELRNFTMSGGVISGNTASWNGGGVYSGNFTMYDGVISDNTADRGGGVYLINGTLFRGEISGNNASSGGGVWIVEDFGMFSVFDGVVFSNNYASLAYDIDPIHDGIYHAQIGDNVSWTEPFTQGYNNYDISYTKGLPILPPESYVEVPVEVIVEVPVEVIVEVPVEVIVEVIVYPPTHDPSTTPSPPTTPPPTTLPDPPTTPPPPPTTPSSKSEPTTTTSNQKDSNALLVISSIFLVPAAASAALLLWRNPGSFNKNLLREFLPKNPLPQDATKKTPTNKDPQKKSASKEEPQIVMSSTVLASMYGSFSLCNGRAFQYFAPLVNIKLDALEVLFQKFNSDNKLIFLQITQAGNVVGEAFGEVVEGLSYGSMVRVRFNFQDNTADVDDKEEGELVLLKANVQHCINITVVCNDVNDVVHLANVPHDPVRLFNVTTDKLGIISLFHTDEVSTVSGNLVFSGTGKFQESRAKNLDMLKELLQHVKTRE